MSAREKVAAALAKWYGYPGATAEFGRAADVAIAAYLEADNADGMSDAQKLITETMRVHRSFYVHGNDHDSCSGCAWKGCGDDEHDAHVAAEIDKALGELTRERRDADDCDCGNEAHPSWCDDDCVRFDPDTAKSRWVSKWSEIKP